MIKSEKRIETFVEMGVKIFTSMPDGWKDIKGALTAPNGYKWIYNGKPIFGDEYEQALLKV